MSRAQVIVHRGDRLLLVKHREQGEEYWCLPGGGIEPGEHPATAALRELAEECHVTGRIVRPTATVEYGVGDLHHTFLVDIDDQTPLLGHDPEYTRDGQILVDLAWLALNELSERDRAYLWTAGLLTVAPFAADLRTWTHSPAAAIRADSAPPARVAEPFATIGRERQPFNCRNKEPTCVDGPLNPHPRIPSSGADERIFAYRISPPIMPADLHALFLDAGTVDSAVELDAMLKRALFYVGAFDGVRLVGFAKVVDDGGVHGFLLDPMVSLALRRRGVGTDLVLACVAEAKRRGIEWLHVDFEPPLEPFYRRCGFVPSMAGVMNLQIEPSNKAPVQIDR